MNSTPHEHIVKSYDEDQRRIVEDVVRMGQAAVAQLEAALDVVERRDDSAARRIVANDEFIDESERRISHDVMLLALRGPMARDLREILAGLRIPADLERIGDLAKNIAKRAVAIALRLIERGGGQPLIAGEGRAHRLGQLPPARLALLRGCRGDRAQARRVGGREVTVHRHGEQAGAVMIIVDVLHQHAGGVRVRHPLAHTFGVAQCSQPFQQVHKALAPAPVALAKGVAQPLSESDWAIARHLGPILAARGLLLVGLDIIGEQLTEINVTSPTCFQEITDQMGWNVAGRFIDALESKVRS